MHKNLYFMIILKCTVSLFFSIFFLKIANAQVGQASIDCRDRNQNGRFECSYTPQIIEDFKYRVSGPVYGSDIYKTEAAAQADWVSQFFSFPLCGRSQNTGSQSSTSYWRPNIAKTKLITYENSYRAETGIPENPCTQSVSVTNYIFVWREIRCAAGWAAVNDLVEDLDYCARQITQACDHCLGNPITFPGADKIQRETDYISAANPLLAWKRNYRSSGRSVLPGMSGNIWVSAGYGNFWSHYYDKVLSVPLSSTGVISLRRDDEVTIHFPMPTSYPASLKPNNSSDIGVLRAISASENEFYSSDNLIERYINGRLASIHSLDGKWVKFDVPGNFSRVYDVFGRFIDLTKDKTGKITKINSLGSIFKYDFSQSPVNPQDKNPDGSPFVGSDYIYLSEVTYPDLTKRKYIQDSVLLGSSPIFPHQLKGVMDENNSIHSIFKYAGDGRASSTELAGDVGKWEITSEMSFSNPLGGAQVMHFDTILGKKVITAHYKTSDAQGNSIVRYMSYDANGNKSSEDDFTGKRACYTHDLTRNLETARIAGLAAGVDCASVIPPNATLPVGSRKISTQWHPDWRLESRTAEPGRITINVYNGQPDPSASGVVTSCAPASALLPNSKPIAVLCKRVEQATTDADGAAGFAAPPQAGVAARTWKWTYNNFGQVLTEDGPRTDVADVTTYTYHAATAFTGTDPNAVGVTVGDLKSITNAAGKTTNYTKYNKHGQLLESSDPNGVVSSYTYDLRQRLLSATIGGQKTSYTYDAAGQLKRITRPDTSWVGYDYDPAHRLVAVYDNLGNRIDYTLDNAGNRTAENVKDLGGVLKRHLARTIDPLGRVQQTTGLE